MPTVFMASCRHTRAFRWLPPHGSRLKNSAPSAHQKAACTPTTSAGCFFIFMPSTQLCGNVRGNVAHRHALRFAVGAARVFHAAVLQAAVADDDAVRDAQQFAASRTASDFL